ncbi:hypothetical protein PSTG_13095 [Puccinia striiformis f. sp. tritici PST-78]|uniref:Uncharacterized protein n=1 Tax=Puccinia striiformis f. sp. tritici PST-78 TaxID=1165861 RepID=A0A0L0V2R0_9BASI|nr:hypothetical protein PSTG_13095 [Puccinia striiformis f. sp. tritici PST-78]
MATKLTNVIIEQKELYLKSATFSSEDEFDRILAGVNNLSQKPVGLDYWMSMPATGQPIADTLKTPDPGHRTQMLVTKINIKTVGFIHF